MLHHRLIVVARTHMLREAGGRTGLVYAAALLQRGIRVVDSTPRQVARKAIE
ncbi:MAG: hypothetical protein M3014_07625 [Chloroflexota bacterium]|nr:hypothetical protein [Chloroflexota bacterium]